MNDEPTYDYVKGVGWVPSVYESVSSVLAALNGDKCKVTLIRRLPELGERGFSIYTDAPLADLVKQIHVIKADDCGWPCNQSNYEYTRANPKSWNRWVTVKVEPYDE